MSNPSDPNMQQPAAPDFAAPAAPQQPAVPAYTAPAPAAAPAAPAAPYQAAPQYAAAPRTNTMAIISMISSIVGWFTFGILCVLGVILGHISLGQIKRSGEGGKGMAVAGLIVGYIGIVGWIIGAIIFFVVMAMLGAALSDPNIVSELERAASS